MDQRQEFLRGPGVASQVALCLCVTSLTQVPIHLSVSPAKPKSGGGPSSLVWRCLAKPRTNCRRALGEPREGFGRGCYRFSSNPEGFSSRCLLDARVSRLWLVSAVYGSPRCYLASTFSASTKNSAALENLAFRSRCQAITKIRPLSFSSNLMEPKPSPSISSLNSALALFWVRRL